jgi:ApbE superfamily uncharacterized protein (UPF0280 family)
VSSSGLISPSYAIGLADRAVLVWETASEADTLGFDVLRAASAEVTDPKSSSGVPRPYLWFR